MTSLFGGSGGGAAPSDGRMGAEEPWEKAIECVSGPALDRRLPCCESGRRDRRLIQELLEETESLGFSVMGCAPRSPGRTTDCLLLRALGGVTWALAGRWRGAAALMGSPYDW